MARRAIIVTNSAVFNHERRNLITEYLNKKCWEVWHWMEDLWLVANLPDETTPTILTRELDPADQALLDKALSQAKDLDTALTAAGETTPPTPPTA